MKKCNEAYYGCINQVEFEWDTYCKEHKEKQNFVIENLPIFIFDDGHIELLSKLQFKSLSCEIKFEKPIDELITTLQNVKNFCAEHLPEYCEIKIDRIQGYDEPDEYYIEGKRKLTQEELDKPRLEWEAKEKARKQAKENRKREEYQKYLKLKEVYEKAEKAGIKLNEGGL